MSTRDGAILLGYGGSTHSKLALAWADHLAHRLQRPLRVLVSALDVVDTLEASTELGAAAVVAELETILETAQAPTTSVTTVLTAPGPALVREAQSAHLTVLGSRAHGALASMVLGSVSQHVTRHAPGPVVVVREPQDPTATRIVVGVDGSSGSQAALEFAFAHADEAGVPLAVLHAVLREAGTPGTMVADQIAPLAEKYPAVVVETQTVEASPDHALVDASQGAAMVVVGSRGRGALAALLKGSIAQSVLQHAQCPVAVVR
ncbi:universal stress protein [Nocardioides sp.]|uniref:universal stress protein n=1 Tax=Nocardioides sp. TaxID=35761 RepID=UPI002734F67A|nr:universal stress protein [Nocardioides sp.]MDP3889925.1 universal stress protein [Nocardioides sp.]